MNRLPTYVTSFVLGVTLLLGSGVTLAAVAYRWVDAQGVVHIQDQPHEGATEIELDGLEAAHTEPTSATSSYAARNGATVNRDSTEEVKFTCGITQPADDAVLFSIDSLTISVLVQPALRGTDRLTVSYDGKPLPAAAGATSFTVSPVDRGEHTVVATVQDGSSKTVCTSPTVTFNVRQPGLRTR